MFYAYTYIYVLSGLLQEASNKKQITSLVLNLWFEQVHW